MAMRRFEIAQESMLPNLAPGDEVVAVDSRRPQIGDVVVFPHPGRDGFWLVKRMVEPPRHIGEDEAWVLSDNPAVTRADSRSLGPIPLGTLWTVVDRLDPTTFQEACVMLAAEDEVFAGIIEEYGIPEFWRRRPGLGTLVWLILEQQVSLESGAAMYRRLADRAGGISAGAIAGMGPEGMRRIGVTRQKARYLHELALAVRDDELDLGSLANLPAESARDRLQQLKGVGPWTADAYLLSALGHIDIFPVGDRALQVGVGEVLGMGTVPDEAELEILSQPWKPVRAAAARLVWHAYLAKRGRVEPTDPVASHGDE